MDKTEHCKEVYAYYGLAMYRAQCVEQSIIQLLIFCDLYEREAKSKHTQEEWEAKFDSFDQEVSDKTMGRLIGHLKSLNVLQSTTESLLAKALKERNFLAHSYFQAKAMCSGLMIPDTKLGGKVSTINEVFHDKTTTTYIFCRIQNGCCKL
ncbi:hypothetical protein ACEWA0_22800, partial [Vibrio parahaemolyticus]